MLKKMDDARNSQISITVSSLENSKKHGNPCGAPDYDLALSSNSAGVGAHGLYPLIVFIQQFRFLFSFCCGLSTSGTAAPLLMPAHSRRGLGYA